MDNRAEDPWREVLTRVLRDTQYAQLEQFTDIVNGALRPVGLLVDCYLVDEEQLHLRALPRTAPVPPAALPVRGSVAGRVFTTLTAQATTDAYGTPVLWYPLVDGTERMGVLSITGTAITGTALTETALTETAITGTSFAGGRGGSVELQERCRDLMILFAHLIAVGMRYSDVGHRLRRTREMSLAGELLQPVLPPLTYTAQRIGVSCLLQPFYEAGGDVFDYAVDGSSAFLCLADAVGHGPGAALMAITMVAALRSVRRSGGDLYAAVRAAEAALEAQFGRAAFVTAVLARLDLETGRLRYVNAGHAPPMLFRHAKLVGELTGGRHLPLGFGDTETAIGEAVLEPGDRLLLYSDGVVEARDPDRQFFGVPRLVDLVEQAELARLPLAEVLRNVARQVDDFTRTGPQDDATLMLVEWSREAPDRMRVRLPGEP